MRNDLCRSVYIRRKAFNRSEVQGSMETEKLTGKIKDLEFRPHVLGEQVSRILTEAILEGVLKGGDQLIEAELQNQFGISRSPLREAFRDLEKQGLVVIIPRKGTYVKQVSRKDIQDNFPVRAVLEGLAAREAHPKVTDQILEGLSQALVKPTGVQVVSVELWRDYLFKSGTLDKDAANPRADFKRLRDALAEKGVANEWNGKIWLVSGSQL